MVKILVIVMVFVSYPYLFADDFGRDVSIKSGFEDTRNELKPEKNLEFIKQGAKAKASYGKQSGGIYTKEGSQTVGSTILQNSKVQNVYNYSEIKGPVVNVNKR